MTKADSLAPLPFARTFLRHWRKMAVFFLVVLAGTAAGTTLIPRTYRSQAKLLVRLGRENTTLDPTATLGQGPVVAAPSAREAELNSVIEMLLSRDLLAQVVDAVGPEVVLGLAAPGSPNDEGDARTRDRAVVRLTKMVRAEAVKRSNVLVVTCDGPSPEACQAIVARLLDLAVTRHITIHRTPGAYQFLDEQARRSSALVARTEEELLALQNATGLASPEEQRRGLVARIGRLEDELLQATATIAGTEAEARTVRARLAGLSATHVTARTRGFPNTATDALRAQVHTLQVREKELAARHPDEHPEVKQARQQLAASRALLAREEAEREQVTVGPNKLHEESQLALARQEALLASARARQESVGGQLTRERAALRTLEADALRIARLRRKLDMEVAHHRRYAEGREQGQIDRALQAERISNLNVVQPATLDPLPVRPRTTVSLAFGLLLALSGSIGLAFLADSLRNQGNQGSQAQPAKGPPSDHTSPPAAKPIFAATDNGTLPDRPPAGLLERSAP